MQSFDFSLTIINGSDYIKADLGIIESSKVHRVTLTTVSWMPKNRFVLINEIMRQRLGLNFDKTLPPQYLGSCFDDIISSRGPYRLCENIYLSTISTSPLAEIAFPVLVPDLSVDFVLGTMYFHHLGLEWNSNLNRIITRREQEERNQEEARRQTYRNIL